MVSERYYMRLKYQEEVSNRWNCMLLIKTLTASPQLLLQKPLG